MRLHLGQVAIKALALRCQAVVGQRAENQRLQGRAVRVPWLRTTRIGSTDLGSKTTTIEFVPVPPPPQAFEHMPK